MRPLFGSEVDRLGILDEAVASLTQRKGRTALTCLGTLLGVGVLISVLGLTASATSQIDSRFTELSATEVSISQLSDGVATRAMAFPRDFESRVKRIAGVHEVGLVWRITPEVATVRRSPVSGTVGPEDTAVDVVAASPGALRVAHVETSQGRTFDDYAQHHPARVALLGPTAAAELGIIGLQGRPSVTVGGVAFVVVGMVDSVERHPELLNAVVIPTRTARSLWGDPGADAEPTGWVEVAKGAGSDVADQLAMATSAVTPGRFEVIAPPDPAQLRGSVGSDLRGLFLVLAAICLIVGMVGIANTTFVTVMERIGEIGLRRALGARRVHIAGQFLAEAAVIGLIGGMLGTLTGLGVVVGVALANGWTAVLPSGLILAGPVIGVVTALLAAVYPALRGARTEPITALRGVG